jgi:hypothetical protein
MKETRKMVQSRALSRPFGFPAEFLEIENQLAAQEPLTPVSRPALDQAIFSGINPYWKLGRAQAFWIPEKGHVIGFYHPEVLVDGKPVAFFGYWSTSNDSQINQELFVEVEAWASGQNVSQLIGPLNMKTTFDYRLRIDHWEAPSFWGEPQNPPFYQDILQARGFTVCQNYFTDFIEDLERVRKIGRKKLPAFSKSEHDFKFIRFSEDVFETSKTEILALANRIFADNFAFQELNPFDFAILYNPETLQLACHKTSFLLYDHEKVLRGLCFNFPDPNDSKRILVKTIGIDPAARNSGRTFAACLKYLFEHSNDYDRMAFCLMLKDNQAHRIATKYSIRERGYALFRKAL